MDERLLAAQVSRFYALARRDADLGPVFNDAISDWDRHEALLTRFWSSVMLGSGDYHGNPMAAHLRHLHRLSPPLFDRWLDLWSRTAAEVLPPPAAAQIVDRARRIATSLQLGLFYRPGRPPASPAPLSHNQDA